MRTPTLALASCLLVSCNAEAPPPAAPLEPAGAAPARPAPPPPPPHEAAAGASEGPREAPPPDGLTAQLGAPCSPGALGCGRAGAIAVAIEDVGQVLEPWKPSFCKLERVSATIGRNATSACVKDGMLAIHSRCIVCRIDSSRRLVAVIAEMTEEQLESAQRTAGLPTQPLLASERAWVDALARAAATAGP